MTGPARFLLVATALLLALGLAPSATSDAPAELTEAKECAPPCGYIYPTIGLDTDLPKPVPTSTLGSFPEVIDVHVTYSWDMEQDGTGVPGDVDEMTITVVATKVPDWATARVEPSMCSFRLLPQTNEYDVCTVQVHVTIDEFPGDEVYLEDFGKRLMLFATSRESGMFKKSYGVEDIRFKWDEAPADVANLGTSTPTATIEEAPGVTLPLLVATGAALALAARRRR